ncbi:caspase-7-like [Haliotis rufescens]|uniref:caspase-7-like n=1 Tax=Haliotis rufescens TaxID=6454 RepID=UPI00201FA2BE|nr:caspase-7-like [Haliotis rufescens]
MSAPDPHYNMSHKKRGLAYIITNSDFDHLPHQPGNDVDEERLIKAFGTLSFDVTPVRNLTVKEMVDGVEKVSTMDHTNNDCFVCVILSHGEEDKVHGTDGPVEVTKLLAPFRGDRCGTLDGKPKLFFIQTCGKKFDDWGDFADALDVKGDVDGDEEMDDGEPITYRVPITADFLIAYSSAKGSRASTNQRKGSCYIQALCEVLEEHGMKLELMALLTQVNKKVAFGCLSNVPPSPYTHGKRQIPCITSMLTGEVRFQPK